MVLSEVAHCSVCGLAGVVVLGAAGWSRHGRPQEQPTQGTSGGSLGLRTGTFTTGIAE